MSLLFNGTTDNVISDATLTWGSTRSLLAWIKPSSQGESDTGTVLDHGDDAAARCRVRFNGTAGSKKLRYVSNRATTDGIWDMTTGFATLNQWHGCLWTYDASSTTNDPTLYLLDLEGLRTLTVGSGLSETSTPNGAEVADGLTVYVGGNLAETACYAGLIGEVALWDTVLSASDAKAVLLNGAMAYPQMLLYWSFDSGSTTAGGASRRVADLSGHQRTAEGDNPTIDINPPTRPGGRRG